MTVKDIQPFKFLNNQTMLTDIISFRWIDLIDILLVSALVYELYRLLKGSNVMRIFWAVVIIIAAWRVVDAFNMRLSGAILSAIINVGLIALVVVFQPEIRKFLLMVGTKTHLDGNVWRRLRFWHNNMQSAKRNNYDAYIQACMHMSSSKTGALIIFRRQNELDEIIQTGQTVDAPVSAPLLEALFFKNSPLHDGAVIAKGNRILAARCILPVTQRTDIDPNLGLRHRSAIGISEQLDVISVVVSEETGAISYVVNGEIHHDVSASELQRFLEENGEY